MEVAFQEVRRSASIDVADRCAAEADVDANARSRTRPVGSRSALRPDALVARVLQEAGLDPSPADTPVGSVDACLAYLNDLTSRGAWLEAEKAALLAVQRYPHITDFWEVLGRTEAQLMRLDLAEALYARAIDLEGDRIFSLVARRHIQDRELSEARSREEWALLCDSFPRSFWTHEGAVLAAVRKGDFAAADAAYTIALERFGHTPDIASLSHAILAGRARAGETGVTVQYRLLECLRETPPADPSIFAPRLLHQLAEHRRIEKPLHRALRGIAKAAFKRRDSFGVPAHNRDLLQAYFELEDAKRPLRKLKKQLILSIHRNLLHFVFQGYYSAGDRAIATELLEEIATGPLAGTLSGGKLYKIMLVALTLDAAVCARFLRAVDKAHASTPADLSKPLGVVLHAARQRAAVDDDLLARDTIRSTAPALRSPRRLSIALCVSGQLRGFERGRRSWEQLGLKDHDVTTFVHVWRRIGRKAPSFGMEHEVFRGAFMEAFRKEQQRLGGPALKALYPKFLSIFSSEDDVSDDVLRSTYQSDFIVCEDERTSHLAGAPNMEKMYFKAQACFEMAAGSGRSFDLFVRIRPDFCVRRVTDWDWSNVHARCVGERAIVVERIPLFGNAATFQMADQFAVGAYDTMSIFTSAYSLTKHAEKLNIYGFPRRFVIHDNFGWASVHGGIRTIGAGSVGMNYGLPFDRDELAPSFIRQALLEDIGSTARNDTDHVLLEALDADIAEGGDGESVRGADV